MNGRKEFLAAVRRNTDILLLLPSLHEIRSQQLSILTYNHIFDASGESQFPYNPVHVGASVSESRGQMSYVASHFVSATLADDLSPIDGGKALPQRAIDITFDNGHAGPFANAFPVLRRVGLSAAFFLASDYVCMNDVFDFEIVSTLVFGTHVSVFKIPELPQRVSLTEVSSRRKTTEILLDHLKNLHDMQRRAQIDWQSVILGAIVANDDAGLSSALTWEQVRKMARSAVEVRSHSISHAISTRLDAFATNQELCNTCAEIERQLGCAVTAIGYRDGCLTAIVARVMYAEPRPSYRLGLSYIPDLGEIRCVNRFTIPQLQSERDVTTLVSRNARNAANI